MKKFFIFAIVLMSMVCFTNVYAADVVAEWEHDGQNVDGFTAYFWQTTNPATVWNKTVTPGSATTMTIGPEEMFAVGVEYSFIINAYNTSGQSADSNTATWTRPGTPYVPPGDTMPTSLHLVPNGVDTIVISIP